MSKTPPSNHPEQETHTQEPQGQATTEQEATPPWERDGEEFNPERAWALIQALRAEKEQLKTKVEQAAAAVPAQAPAEPAKEEGTEEPAQEEPAKAGKTESQDATAAELAATRAELNKVRALAAAGVDIALAPYLPEGTPEELAEHIKLLRSKLGGGSAASPTGQLEGTKGTRLAVDPAQHATHSPSREELAAAFFGSATR
ncbi:hypothetical protein [Rothia mucilaginosa]|uniref:hypothetical protein n=1 Tax=Rothia mucilaginosa TaxID=43675 RepID=UPI003C76666C